MDEQVQQNIKFFETVLVNFAPVEQRPKEGRPMQRDNPPRKNDRCQVIQQRPSISRSLGHYGETYFMYEVFQLSWKSLVAFM
jgi:hypothetical protein